VKTLTTITRAASKVTDAQIAALEFNPIEEGETVLGTISRRSTRQLWVLAKQYHARSRAAAFAWAEGDKDDKKMFLAQQLYAMCELIRDIGWLEMKDEIGPSSWEAHTVCVRTGFTLVSCKPEEEPTMKAVAIPLSGFANAFKEVLTRMLAASKDPDPEPPTGKVQ